MQRQGHCARQPTHANNRRPTASEQTFRHRQSTAPQQTRRDRRTTSAQLHSQRRRPSTTIRWTRDSRAAAIDRHATSAL